MSKVFVSYKRVDEKKVFPLVHKIEAELGFRFWVDLNGIISDEQFSNVIINAINNCEVFLFMYSRSHENINPQNDWTVREIIFAEKKGKRIVFIDLDGYELPDWFIFRFPDKQIVSANDNRSLDKLTNDIRNWLHLGTDITMKSEGKVFSPVIKRLVNNMVYVEGGTFIMGATTEQRSDAYKNECPSHQVTLSSFYIGRYEVTQEEWQTVMGNNPSYFKDSNCPVECVSWDDCQEFIKKLNTMTGMKFRLPTESEWEYAARGGNKSRGTKYAGGNDIGSVAWVCTNSNSRTHPVGQKLPNELGLYDMSGNVLEWCFDRYGDYSSSSQTNPQGPSYGSDHVFRGGSWHNLAWFCRVSRRCYDSSSYRYDNLGLRLAQ